MAAVIVRIDMLLRKSRRTVFSIKNDHMQHFAHNGITNKESRKIAQRDFQKIVNRSPTINFRFILCKLIWKSFSREDSSDGALFWQKYSRQVSIRAQIQGSRTHYISGQGLHYCRSAGSRFWRNLYVADLLEAQNGWNTALRTFPCLFQSEVWKALQQRDGIFEGR